MALFSGRRVTISGLGMCVPEKVLTNHDLEKMVDTSDQWITERSGIKERRILSDGEYAYQIASKAAEEAINDAGLSPSDIDGIIVATNSPDTLFPATACRVQNEIGAKPCACCDIQSGCTGSVYALTFGASMISSGLWNNAVIIGVEALSRIINWQDRNTCVLFGDGAGAVVLSSQDKESERRFLSVKLYGDGKYADLITLPAGLSMEPATHATVDAKKHFVHMKGNDVFKFVVRILPKFLKESVEEVGMSVEDIDWWIFHQANWRIMEAVLKRVGVDPSKAIVNLQKYGNTSAASVFLALYEAVKEGKIKEKDVVLITSFGAGMTWGSVILRW